MEFVIIDQTNAKAFRKLIPSEVYTFVLMPDILAVGIVDNYVAIAAAVFRADDEGNAELLSVCVDEKYRRQGLATELMNDAADILCENANVTRFFCSYEDDGKRESLIAFLKYLDFSIEEDEAACLSTTVGDLKQIEVLKGGGSEKCEALSNLTSRQIKTLSEEEMDLASYFRDGIVDGKMSCVIYEDNAVKGCLIFTKEEDGSLNISWARNEGDRPENMLRMMRHAVAAAKDYPDDKKLYIPLLNASSRKLAEGVLAGHYEKCEQSYKAELYLFEE